MNYKRNLTEINLSSLIPFRIYFSKLNQLVFEKGIMQSTIHKDSIILEIARLLKINPKKIALQSTKNGDISINFPSKFAEQRDYIKKQLLATISNELPNNLINKDTHKPLFYITKEIFEMPLIGSFYFGLIDRGTNLLQIRSITGCPLNCPFCSVDEGPASKSKLRDFIVEPEYLTESYNFVVEKKSLKNAEAHLDGQGEPMSYPYLIELVNNLAANPNTKYISIQTNGWYLTEEIIDELEEAGLSRINLSINAFSLQKAKKLSGRGDIPFHKIIDMAKYISNSEISLLIAPLWIPTLNNQDIEEIIKFAIDINKKENKFPILGIQNYLTHPEGRNINGIKQKKFSDFYLKLKEYQKKYSINDLILKQDMFETFKSPMIPNPLKVNEIIEADVILPGRVNNEVLAKARSRIIHVSNASENLVGKRIKIKITRNRHNIFFGTKI